MRAPIDWTLHTATALAEKTRRTLRTIISEREDYEPPIHNPPFHLGSRCGNMRPLRTTGCVMRVDLIGDSLPDE